MGIQAHFLQDKNQERFYPYGHAGAVYDKNGDTVQNRLDELDTCVENLTQDIENKAVQSDWDETDTLDPAYIKNKPSSMPASDVYAWAKSTSKPNYTWNEIKSKPSTFTPSEHDHDIATSSKNGFMASTDKTKLDGIATGANRTTVDSALSSTSTNPIQNKVVNSALSGKVPTTRTVNGKALSGNITLAASDVGAIPTSQKGATNGVAELDNSGKVPSAQLPSFVDDVVEGYLSSGKFYKESGHTTEINAESGKIYVDLSTNKTYRWSGSAYAEISASLALGETSTTAYRGDRGKIAYDHSQKAHAPSNAEANVQSDWSVSDTGSDAYIKNKPTSLPANGGNSSTVNGHSVQADVPANAVFTDTKPVTMKGATASEAGSAGYVPAPASGSNTKYLRGDGTWQTPPDTNTTYGVATTSSNGLMSSTDKSKLDGIASGANKYTHPSYTSKNSGLYKVTVDSTGHVSATSAVTKSDITALGIPGSDTNTTYSVFKGATSSASGGSGLVPAPTSGQQGSFLRADGTWANPANTTYSIGTASRAGLTKLYASTGSATDGTMTQNAITTALNGKASSSHTHNYAGSSSAGGAANSVKSSLIVKLNGGTTEGTNMFTFNGGTAKTINVTPSAIGAAASSHGTHVTYSTTAPKANGTASAGTAASVSRSDHVHPLQTSVSGNAGTATKLATARSINDISFDGTKSIQLTSMYAENIGGKTVSLDTYNLSSGTPKIKYYYCATDGDGSNITGRPSDSTKQAFILRCESIRWASTTDYITKQTYIQGSTKITWERFCVSGTWSAWGEVYTSQNKPTASEIGAAPSSHTHNYAGSGSAGGSANSAVKLDTSSAGSATKPVYFSGGKPVACTYTLGKSVPSNAVFTDTNTWIAFKGATTEAAGTAGYAPAPSAGAANRYLRSDGTWSVPPDTNTTYSNMSAATASTAGKAGLVPAPAAGAQSKYLRGDGTWQTPPNTTYSTATTSTSGLMSASDKSKLDGIASGANKYTLPTASSTTLGGVKTTSSVTSTSGLTACPIISGVPYYKDTNTTYTLSSFGITATAAELNKLDGVTATATELNYVDGVTSNIQTQLNGKAASSHNHSAANITSGTLAITRGGTGATTAAAARTNLGVTNVTVSTSEPTTQSNGDFWFKEV